MLIFNFFFICNRKGFLNYEFFIRETVEFCKRAEKAGASWISVHGRTKVQRNEPVNFDAIKIVKENLSIPVVGNGDVFHLRDAHTFQRCTAVNGKILFILTI